MPKLSIIVPIYNVEQFLPACLDSLLAQDFADFEVLCVVDGSPDGSRKIAERYADADRRFRVLVKENGGLSSARNFGIDHATGEILAFVDADDFVEPGFAGKIVSAMDGADADVLVFGATVDPAGASTPWYERTLTPPEYVFEGFSPDLVFDGFATPFVWRNAVRRSVLESTGLRFDEDLPFGEDVVFQFALYPRSGVVATIPDQLYRYRVGRTGSLMDSREEDAARLAAHEQMLRVILDDWRSLGLIDRWPDRLFDWSCEYLLYGADRLSRADREQHVQRVVALWDDYFAETADAHPVTVEQECLCRGDGKLYALCRVRAVVPFSRLDVAAFVDGSPVPVGAYPFDGGEGDAEQSWVLELPLLATRAIDVQLAPDGRLYERASVSFDFQKAKWASRLNYRLRPELSNHIRDYELNFAEGAFRVEIVQRYESHADAVWRFSVSWNGPVDVRPDIAVADASGHPLAGRCVFCEFQPAAAGVEGADAHPSNVLHLSLTLPADHDHFVLTAVDPDGDVRSGFTVMTPEFADVLRSRMRDQMKSAADDDDSYRAWLATQHAELIDPSFAQGLQGAPRFCVVIAASGESADETRLLEQTLLSLQSQTYEDWEAVVVGSTAPTILFQGDDRIRFTMEAGIAALWQAAQSASCDFTAFMQAGDMLEPYALCAYAKAIAGAYGDRLAFRLAAGEGPAGQVDVLYCDEDTLDGQGRFSRPVFKSRLNLDAHYCRNWVGGFLAMRHELLRGLEPHEAETVPAWLYGLTLAALESGAAFSYVPHLLFHARASLLDGVSDDMRCVLSSHLARRGLGAQVVEGDVPMSMKAVLSIPSPHPMVSIVIPSKDHIDLLDACVRSIIERSTYDAYEIIVVENNSTEPETLDNYAKLQAEFACVRVACWPDEFNYSKIVNFGAMQAKGDYLLFLNNDTEVIAPGFIEEMLGIAQREEVAVVGAKLLFRDDLVQHAGVGVGIWNAVVHYNQNHAVDVGGYLDRACLPGNYSAVTGACQMVRTDVFEKLGGYDGRFAVGFNDVDFCLRALRAGYVVSFAPAALLYHYEFASRGREQADGDKLKRWQRERDLFEQLWPEPFASHDAYTSPNLMHDNTYFRLADDVVEQGAGEGVRARVRNVVARFGRRA